MNLMQVIFYQDFLQRFEYNLHLVSNTRVEHDWPDAGRMYLARVHIQVQYSTLVLHRPLDQLTWVQKKIEVKIGKRRTIRQTMHPLWQYYNLYQQNFFHVLHLFISLLCSLCDSTCFVFLHATCQNVPLFCLHLLIFLLAKIYHTQTFCLD